MARLTLIGKVIEEGRRGPNTSTTRIHRNDAKERVMMPSSGIPESKTDFKAGTELNYWNLIENLPIDLRSLKIMMRSNYYHNCNLKCSKVARVRQDFAHMIIGNFSYEFDNCQYLKFVLYFIFQRGKSCYVLSMYVIHFVIRRLM